MSRNARKTPATENQEIREKWFSTTRKARDFPPEELDELIDIWLNPGTSRNLCRKKLEHMRLPYEVGLIFYSTSEIRARLKTIRTRLLNALESLDETGKGSYHQKALSSLSKDFPQLQELIDLLDLCVKQTNSTGEKLGRVQGGNEPDLRKRWFVAECWKCLNWWPKENPTKEKLQGFSEALWKTFSGEEEPNFKRAVDGLYPELRRNRYPDISKHRAQKVK